MSISLSKLGTKIIMIRLLNILFLGLAVLFFAVLALAMYKSVRYVNENQPYILSQKESTAKSSSNREDSFSFPLSGNDTTAMEDELPEIDFAAIDSLLDDDEELDSLIRLTDDGGQMKEGEQQKTDNEKDIIASNQTNKKETKDEGQKDEEATATEKKDTKVLNEKPKNDTKEIAKAKTPTKRKATPTSYSQRGNYYIAVGAFKDRSNANLVQGQLKKLGFKNIKRIKNNNFTLIRLQGYPKKSSAQGDLTKVRKFYKEAYIRKK